MQNSIPNDFTVRIRFRIASRDRLGVDANEAVFTPAVWPQVLIKSADEEGSIRDADWLALQCSGWDSEEAAKGAVEPLMDALRRSLARHDMGADLGRRFPGSGFFPAGLRLFEEQCGRTALNDIHGPMVFATELRPVLARPGSMTGYRTVHDDRWKKTFTFALECNDPLSDRERTAFDLFSVSHVVRDSGDARFVLLFAAIETLLEESPRPKPVVDHIDRLITLTSDTSLDRAEKHSLLGSLRWLRSHSIRSSGRRFVRKRLADRKYQDRPAEEVFLACYDLRNRLMHGGQPFPAREEVGGLVGALDQMVSHLLAGPVVDFDAA